MKKALLFCLLFSSLFAEQEQALVTKMEKIQFLPGREEKSQEVLTEGMICDKKGYFYVLSNKKNNHYLQRFNPQERQKNLSFSLPQASRPIDIAIHQYPGHPHYQVYVLDQGSSKTPPSLYIFNEKEGSLALTEKKSLKRWVETGAQGLATDSEGRIYLSCIPHDTPAIYVFSSSLWLLGKIYSVNTPSSLCFDQKDYLYVLDTTIQRDSLDKDQVVPVVKKIGFSVQEYVSEKEGTSSLPLSAIHYHLGKEEVAFATINNILEWGTLGEGKGAFSNPISLRVDKYGRLYVLDQGNRCWQMFDSDGNFIMRSPNEDMPLSQNLSGIAVNENGSVFVGDVENARVYQYPKHPHF